MVSLKMVLKALVMFCIIGASMASVVAGAAYETYDCDYFSAEYPSDWNTERSLAAEEEGWKYSFLDPDSDIRYISLTIGSDEIRFGSNIPLDAIEGGALDPLTQRFLDTLDFKNSDTVVAAGQNITYKLYDGVYFSVEYPQSWVTTTLPFESYDGKIYSFSDGTPNNIMGVVLGEIRSDDFVGLIILAPRSSVGSGKFEEPIQHFFDTLTFKM